MAILELGGGFAQADLDAYFRSLGIPSPEVTAAGVDGASNQSVRTPTGFQPARSGLSGDPAGREPDHRCGDLRSGLEQQARPRRHRWRGQRRLCAAELAVHIRCSRSRRPDRTGGTRRRRQCRPADGIPGPRRRAGCRHRRCQRGVTPVDGSHRPARAGHRAQFRVGPARAGHHLRNSNHLLPRHHRRQQRRVHRGARLGRVYRTRRSDRRQPPLRVWRNPSRCRRETAAHLGPRTVSRRGRTGSDGATRQGTFGTRGATKAYDGTNEAWIEWCEPEEPPITSSTTRQLPRTASRSLPYPGVRTLQHRPVPPTGSRPTQQSPTQQCGSRRPAAEVG